MQAHMTSSHMICGLYTSGCVRSREQILTQALVISLAKSLPDPAQGYTLYLDNLFPNGPLAKALGQLGMGVMGTARV